MTICFVTVGTTRFDELVTAAVSEPVLSALYLIFHVDSMVVQYGHGAPVGAVTHPDVRVSSFGFKPSLAHDMAQADVIISHAGAGSLIEALRLRKLTVAVVNDTLMGNHQEELAFALRQRNYLVAVASSPARLLEALTQCDLATPRVPYPPRNPRAFAALVDEEMGFALQATKEE